MYILENIILKNILTDILNYLYLSRGQEGIDGYNL